MDISEKGSPQSGSPLRSSGQDRRGTVTRAGLGQDFRAAGRVEGTLRAQMLGIGEGDRRRRRRRREAIEIGEGFKVKGLKKKKKEVSEGCVIDWSLFHSCSCR